MAVAATRRPVLGAIAVLAVSLVVVARRSDAAGLSMERLRPSEAADHRGPVLAVVGTIDASAQSVARKEELRRTAAAPPNGRRDVCDEPRSSRNFVFLLVRRPDQVATEPLLRSTTFNPRDVPLTEADRARIAATITKAAGTAVPLVAKHDEALAAEFAEARRRGQVVDVDQTRFEGRWALSQLGPDPLCREIDGTTWGVARKHMPVSLRTREAVGRCGAEIVERLAQDFAAAGALTAGECGVLVAKARAASAN